jgi:hypothetical protein
MKGVMRDDGWCGDVVGGGIRRRATAPNAQRVKATGPAQMGRHGRPWLSQEAPGGPTFAGRDGLRYKAMNLGRASGRGWRV